RGRRAEPVRLAARGGRHRGGDPLGGQGCRPSGGEVRRPRVGRSGRRVDREGDRAGGGRGDLDRRRAPGAVVGGPVGRGRLSGPAPPARGAAPARSRPDFRDGRASVYPGRPASDGVAARAVHKGGRGGRPADSSGTGVEIPDGADGPGGRRRRRLSEDGRASAEPPAEQPGGRTRMTWYRTNEGSRHIQGPKLMSGDFRKRGGCGGEAMVGAARGSGAITWALLMLSSLTGPARAGKIAWLDDMMQEVIVEAKAGGKGLAREIGGDGASAGARRAGRLFLAHDADEGLE